ACITGPEQVLSDSVQGFELTTESSDLCDQCSKISIFAPKQYKDKPFSHGLFSVFSSGEIKSRSVHSSVDSSGTPHFVGIVNLDEGSTYEVTFAYGEGLCMSYEFEFTGGVGDSSN
ncbi:MAG: hypothetical protein AAF446_01665, partial [Pseudomonadota bacterium]